MRSKYNLYYGNNDKVYHYKLPKYKKQHDNTIQKQIKHKIKIEKLNNTKNPLFEP